MQYQCPLLGALPLDLSIREDADSGRPSVVADPNSAVSQIYRQIARRVGAELWRIHSQTVVPEISISDD